MSFQVPRAAKRLHLTRSTQWMCQDCRRSFASSVRSSQQDQAQQQPPRTPLNEQNDKTTHFGFESVAESLKASKVGAVFSSVASNYDTMNDLMSLGIHRIWKDHFVRNLNPGVKYASLHQQPGQRILDIAGGSGDIAIRMLDHATNVNGDDTTHVTISDINPDMLNEGRKRLSATSYHAAGRVDYLEANAEELSTIESNSIDLYTVAFGIRNFTYKEKALKEAFRVLKPGGVFACLEFAPQLSNPLLNGVYKRWSFSAIPLIGQIVAADRDSYQYLVESIERFPSQPEWAKMIQDAGFLIPGQESDGTITESGWENLSMGIAAIHRGVKPL